MGAMNLMSSLKVFFVCMSLMVSSAIAADDRAIAIIDCPVDHIWDRDDLFRNHPEYLPQLTQIMKDLKEEHGMAIYLVTYSSAIGEKPLPFAGRCHEAWLGEKSDGLVFVLSFNEGMRGAIGRSEKLYNGHFIEEGVMPRISFPHLEGIAEQAFVEAQKEKSELEQVRIFLQVKSENIKERLATVAKEAASRESYDFMGWMALALLVCGVMIALLLKFMGAAGRRANESFHFPDFKVPQRLKVRNGGGKISVIDFEQIK